MAATMLYHYFRKFDGNVCTDWRLTHDLTASLETADGKAKRVNSKAFEEFLNPDYKGSEPGSCQGAGEFTAQGSASPHLLLPALLSTGFHAPRCCSA